jgi:hypothetical protein
MGFLDAFAVVSLRVGQTKETFLEERTDRQLAVSLSYSWFPTDSSSFQNAKAMF